MLNTHVAKLKMITLPLYIKKEHFSRLIAFFSFDFLGIQGIVMRNYPIKDR
jgi:hypothetical protein